MLVRRKKYVCTFICRTLSSPATIFLRIVLVAGIEAARVAAHGDHAGFLLHLHQPFGIGQIVRDRDLDQHVLAGAHALLALLRRASGWARGITASRPGCFRLSARSPVQCGILNFLATSSVRWIAARERNDFNSRNIGERFQMLDAERTLSGEAYFHVFPPRRFTETNFH